MDFKTVKQFLDQMINFAFCDLSFYHNYFATVHRIKTGNRASLWKLQAIRAFLLYGSVHSLFLVFTQSQLSFLANAFLYNLFYLMGFGPGWNLFLAEIAFFAQYCYKLLYRQNSGTSGRILKDILLHEKCNFLFWPTRKVTKSVTQNDNRENQSQSGLACVLQSLIEKLFKRLKLPLTVVQILRVTAALLSKSIGISIIIIPVFVCLLVHWKLLDYFLSNPTQFLPNSWLLILMAFEMSTCLAFTILYAFCRIFQIVISFVIIQFLLSYFIIKQVKEYTTTISTLPAWWVFLRKTPLFLANHSDVSRIYGTLLFISICICLPTSAIGAITLLFYSMRLPWMLLFLGAGFLMAWIIFGFHFALAYLGVAFNGPVKSILRFYYSKNRLFVSLSARLKMARFIEQFHQVNSHSLTYGRFGKITYESFGKHCFFFCKIAAISFKIFRKFNIEN